MKANKQEVKIPLISFAVCEGHSSRSARADKRIEEQARAYARSRDENDTNDSYGGRPGQRDQDEEPEKWLCFYCDKLVDGSSEICPISGCPGTSPKTRLHMGQGTEANRAFYALERGQPVQWWWLLILDEWKRKIAAKEVSPDDDICPIEDREPELELSNRLSSCLRPSGPQVGRSQDGALWQKVRKLYKQLNGPGLLEQTKGRSANWTTLVQRFKEDDGSWNNSPNTWAQSQLNANRNLEWMRMADKMHAEQKDVRVEKRLRPDGSDKKGGHRSKNVGHSYL